MADESSSSPNQPNAPASEEVISLEDLVRQADEQKDATPSESPAGPSEPLTNPSAGSSSPGTSDSGPNVDQLLASEDPAFAASLDKLRAEGAAAVEIDTLEIDKLETGFKARIKSVAQIFKTIFRPVAWLIGFVVQLPERLRNLGLPVLKSSALSLFASLKGGITSFLKLIKNAVEGFGDLPRASKFLAIFAVVLGATSVVTLKTVLKGRILPSFENQFLRSFADIADEKFQYPPEEPIEDFADPLYHPEHVVTIDRIVINLKTRDSEANPMGLFEFFIEASTHEGAVELKDREVEARDLIGRTLEQMTYDELITPEGKNRLKVILRKNLNEFLSLGRVRRVYLKSIILKA